MLARVANSLYWTGRYIERSEHLARYLKVQYFSTLDAPMTQNRDFVLKSILNMYGIEFEADELVDEHKTLLDVGLNQENPASLLSTVFSARENARSVRYTVATELWEVINQYYLFMRDYSADFYKTRGLYDFTVQATKHCAIIRSYLDHTLIHDDIWIFINLGIHLERATQIMRIFRSKLHDIAVLSEDGSNRALLRYQWTITLKVLEAFDMHRRTYRKPQLEASVYEFLLSNSAFPRSVAFNLHQINELLGQLSFSAPPKDPLFFKAGKLASYFRYLEAREIKADLQGFLEEALQEIYVLHTLIDQTYFKVSS